MFLVIGLFYSFIYLAIYFCKINEVSLYLQRVIDHQNIACWVLSSLMLLWFCDYRTGWCCFVVSCRLYPCKGSELPHEAKRLKALTMRRDYIFSCPFSVFKMNCVRVFVSHVSTTVISLLSLHVCNHF